MYGPDPVSVAFADGFTPAECDAIIALAAPEAMVPGHLWGGTGYHVDPDQRNVSTSFHRRGEATGWLFDRLDALFAAAAERLGVEVGAIGEDIQVLRYETGSHFRTWHTDSGADSVERRCLSMSVELSEAADYEGGLLEIVPDTMGRPRTLPRGGAIVFRSRGLHRVTPVTSGVRHALVAWTGAATA